jgi:hypothetical protein
MSVRDEARKGKRAKIRVSTAKPTARRLGIHYTRFGRTRAVYTHASGPERLGTAQQEQSAREGTGEVHRLSTTNPGTAWSVTLLAPCQSYIHYDCYDCRLQLAQLPPRSRPPSVASSRPRLSAVFSSSRATARSSSLPATCSTTPSGPQRPGTRVRPPPWSMTSPEPSVNAPRT